MRSIRAILTQIWSIFTGSLTWLLDGMGQILPKSMQRFGCRRRLAIIDTSANDRNTFLKQSLFGRYSVYQPKNDEMTDGFFIALTENETFGVRLSLPNAVIRHADQSIRLQLRDVSPMPVDQIYYNFQLSPGDDQGRFVANVKICRKIDIDNLSRQLDAPWQAGLVEQDGGSWILHCSAHSQTNWARPFASALLLLAGGLILCTGVSSYLARQADRYVLAQEQLTSQMRSLVSTNDLNKNTALSIVMSSSADAQTISSAIADMHSALPDSAKIEQFTIRENQFVLSGIVAEEHLSDSMPSLTVQDEAENGYRRFSASRTLEGL